MFVSRTIYGMDGHDETGRFPSQDERFHAYIMALLDLDGEDGTDRADDLIDAAFKHVDRPDGLTGRTWLNSLQFMKMARFPEGMEPIVLPYPPTTSIKSFFYLKAETEHAELTEGVDFRFTPSPSASKPDHLGLEIGLQSASDRATIVPLKPWPTQKSDFIAIACRSGIGPTPSDMPAYFREFVTGIIVYMFQVGSLTERLFLVGDDIRHMHDTLSLKEPLSRDPELFKRYLRNRPYQSTEHMAITMRSLVAK